MSAIPRAALEMARAIVVHAIDVEAETIVVNYALDWGHKEVMADTRSPALTALLQAKFALDRVLQRMEGA